MPTSVMTLAAAVMKKLKAQQLLIHAKHQNRALMWHAKQLTVSTIPTINV